MKPNIKIFDSMNVVIPLIMIAAMSAAVSCACSNGSDHSAEVPTVECTAVKCAGCDKKDSCADKVEDTCCPGCDSTAVEDSSYRK